MNAGTDISYKEIKINDLDAMVETHKAAFKEYFLTNLGDKFLYRFYKAYLDDKGTIAIGAYDQEKLVGFILCTKNKSQVMDNFYKDNLFFMINNVVLQVLKMNKVIISGLKSRFKIGVNVITSLVFPKKTQPEPENKKTSIAEDTRLLSIAVLPQYQGTGLSKGMMTFFHNFLIENNIDAVGLSVKSGNTRAIKFYEKMGWDVEWTEKETMYFVKTFKR